MRHEPPRRNDRRTVRVRTRHPLLQRQRELEARSPGFGTVVDLERPSGARSNDGLPEVVARTPGASVRSIGGLGQFSAVSIRGSSAQQVSLFIDGVPVGSTLDGVADLGDLPLDAVSRVEIHRGYVPIVYGGATLGGAIDLIGRRNVSRPRLRIDSGLGSFGARQAGVEIAIPLRRRLTLSTRVGYAGAEGNFRFFDHGGTPTFTGDDATVLRRNDHYDRLLGQLRLDGERGRTRFSIDQRFAWKQQGLPGPGHAQARFAGLGSLGGQTIARVDRALGRIRFAWLGGLGVQRRHFFDPRNEVGIMVNDQVLLAMDGYVSPRLFVRLWRGATLGLVADQRTQWVRVEERAAPAPRSAPAARMRIGIGLAAELDQRLLDDRIHLLPAVRVDTFFSRFAVPAGRGEHDDAGRNAFDVGLSPRLGTRFTIAGPLQARASVGRYFRTPTLLELFGDRGFAIGNEGLRPERGTTVDGGLSFDLSGTGPTVHAQLAGFATWSEDLIQWIAAGSVVRPQNLSRAFARGLEAGLLLAPRRRPVEVQANYTLVDSHNRSGEPSTAGQPLPGRPRHEVFARTSFGWTFFTRLTSIEPRTFATVEYIAGNFLDPSGRLALPPRTLLGLGAELHVGERVHLGAEVRNVLDVRTADVRLRHVDGPAVAMPISDFIGYPLPGRSFWVRLEIAVGLPRSRRS